MTNLFKALGLATAGLGLDDIATQTSIDEFMGTRERLNRLPRFRRMKKTKNCCLHSPNSFARFVDSSASTAA
jgi:hypothetical protein